MRRRDLLTGSAALALSAGAAHAFGIGELGAGLGDLGVLGGAGIPAWVPNRANPPDIAINWATNQAWKKNGGLTTPAALGITTSRASVATNLLPTSPSGFAYSTFAANTTVRSALGRQTYQGATDLFLNSTAPVTQTITLSATGSYTLWVNGSGSAAIAAGTATITGAGTATNGTPVTINCTATGTVVVTISGSLQAVQLEAGTFGTPFIVTAGAPVARGADVTTLAISPGTFGPGMTLSEQASPGAPTAFASTQPVLSFDDGTLANRNQIFRAGGGTDAAFTSIGGSNMQFGTGTPWAQNTAKNIAGSFTSGAQNEAFNGVLATTNTATGTLIGSQIHFGSRADGGTFFNGLATIDAIWLTQAIPNAQLQALGQ